MSSLPDGVCDVNKGVDTAVVHRFPPESNIRQLFCHAKQTHKHAKQTYKQANQSDVNVFVAYLNTRVSERSQSVLPV